MLAFIIVFVILVVDQLTKYLVTQNIALHAEVDFIPFFMKLTHEKNEGASFGMFSEHRWVFMLLSAVAIVGIIVFLTMYRKRHILLTIGLAFILGGGIGNMIDRIFRDTVVDFFEFTFVRFAIFNVADMFITFGAIVLGIYVIFYETKIARAEKAKAMNDVGLAEMDKKSNDNTDLPE